MDKGVLLQSKYLGIKLPRINKAKDSSLKNLKNSRKGFNKLNKKMLDSGDNYIFEFFVLLFFYLWI